MSNQPQVPPRPKRDQAAPAQVAAPIVPPRPSNRSPLNENPFPVDSSSQLQRVASLNASRSSLDMPARPPSVTLPSIGQEGSEYDASTPMEEEAIDGLQDSPGTLPTHTRKVSHDLPLHAPRPSLSSADAKQRVAAVVRTDPAQASSQRPLKARPSFQRPGSSASHERPRSAYEDEHGIPSFGVQVPLGNQYGDVQAPSPAPFGSQASTPRTPGFDHSRPGTGKHHNRKHSGRNDFQAPPGSYGLHGHGVQDTSDPFEKDWLLKHPDAQKDELAAHSPAIIDRHAYNLTPAELNKLVKQSREPGFGASAHNSMPDEQIGYLVSEKYSSRGATPSAENTRPGFSQSAHTDSPLKRASMTADDLEKAAALNAASKNTHVDAPEYKESKHLGRGQAAEQEHADLGPHGGNTDEEGGYYSESGYGVPILASDEVDPSGNYLQPALPPVSEGRRGSADHYGRSGSRPSSRPGSIHNVPGLARVASRPDQHTHLDDVREYEPLFPEEDEKSGKKPLNPADRFKQRPELKQRFPSQDIWEDAPPSVMMSAEVETPEEEPRRAMPVPTFETPEAERARKGEVSEQERSQLLSKEARLAKSQFKPHLKKEMRPGAQRFPSRDIWEDTPDSAYMTTTVGDEEEEERNLADEAGAVVQTSDSQPREGVMAGAPAVALPEGGSKSTPSIPPRPTRSISPNKVSPQIPARPARKSSDHQDKPSVPARPTKALSPNDGAADPSAEDAGSSRSIGSAKPKPPVPARPVGGKIAALQAGFMSDLNKKLGLGPQERAPKKEEPEAEEDKKPLEDARKGRARGPARRKPASSPSAAAVGGAGTSASATQPRAFAMTQVFNLYDISPEGQLTATHADTCQQELEFKDGLEETAKKVEAKTEAPISSAIPPAAGFNTAGEAVHPPTITPEAVRATAQTSEPASTKAAQSSSAIESSTEPASSKGAEHEEPSKGLTKQRTTSSSGTQTGELKLVLDKTGSNPQTVTGYKDGSAHEEGFAFVKDEEKE